MKFKRVVILAAISLLLSSTWASAKPGSVNPFLGRWDITLKGPNAEYPYWVEVRQEGRQLKARMVGRFDCARELPKVEISAGRLTFVSPKEAEGTKEDMIFQGKFTGKSLRGTVNGLDGETWTWTGERAPALKRAKAPKWGKPIQLFNGKDLNGWKMSQAGPPEWTVQDGTLVSPGHGPEIITESKFQDFKLHIEFNCGKNSNSGVYLRGRYEVQIETESEAEPPSHHTGGVYGFLDPSPELARSPDMWQSFDITLVGRRVTVVQNGKTIIGDQEIPGITGGAVDSREGTPGPIYLQGAEKGHVAFRNIVITPAL